MKAKYTVCMVAGILLLSLLVFGPAAGGAEDEYGIEGRYDFFQVEINSPEDGAEFRDQRVIRVEYTVTNLGGISGRQEIIFSADRPEIEGVTLGLEAGEIHRGEFYWDLSDVSQGEYILSVRSENTRDAIKVAVGTPPLSRAIFHVDIFTPQDRDRFAVGDVVEVGYSVENLGREEGTQNILFMVDRTRMDVLYDLTLGGGEAHRGTFQWNTRGYDEDYYSLIVSSEDTRDIVQVEIGSSKLGPAVFRVDIVSPEPRARFLQGDTVPVEYLVENVGREEGTQNIVFSVDRWRKDVLYDLTLEPGEAHRGTFRWVIQDIEDSVYHLSVNSDNAVDTVPVIVGRPIDDERPFFNVEITSPENREWFDQGDIITVEYTVENTGAVRDTQNIVFSVDRWRVDVLSDLTLEPGESYDGTFAWDTSRVERGVYYLSVHSDNMRDVVEVAVGTSEVSRAIFRVDILEPENRDRFPNGHVITVSYTVSNVGREEGTQNIYFRVDRRVEGVHRELTLAPGESHEGTFTWDTFGAPDDVYQLSVHSDNTADVVSIFVGKPNWERDFFRVTITSPESREEFQPGDVIQVTYTVENAGRVEGTQDVYFGVNRVRMDVLRNLTLAPGESHRGSFLWDTADVREGIYRLHVRCRDTADMVPVTVGTPPSVLPYFRVRIRDRRMEGNRVTVRFNVINTAQSEPGTQRVMIFLRTRGSETMVYDEFITLAPGESLDDSFTIEVIPGRDYTIELKSMDDDIEVHSDVMTLNVAEGDSNPLPVFLLILLVAAVGVVFLTIRQRSGKRPVRDSQYDGDADPKEKDWSEYYDRD